jgi:hypothetical protein
MCEVRQSHYTARKCNYIDTDASRGCTTTEEEVMHTTMYIIDESGHSTLEFDDVVAAEREFERQREQGFIAFAGDGIDSELVAMRAYVPGFPEIYWVRPLAGG